MRWTLIFLACITLAGCVISDGDTAEAGRSATSGRSVTGQSGLEVSAWLNPDAVISQAQRLTTPSGIDLRRARYINGPDGEGRIGGPEPLIILQLRDYSRRRDGQADRQYIAKLDPATGATSVIELAEMLIPVSFNVEAGRSRWVLNALDTGDDGGLARSKAVIRVYEDENDPQDVPLTTPLHAMGFITDSSIVARPIKRTILDGGLVAVVLDWQENQQQFSGESGKWQETAECSFIQSDSGRRACGYRINHEPSLPAASLVSYHLSDPLTGRTTEQLVHTSPFYVVQTGIPWEPVLGWADESCLFAVDFLPGATGRGRTPNSRGLFRLISIDPEISDVRLIEDHMAPGLPVVSGEGVIFYTRQALAGDGAAWELWAASNDGLRKYRLWSIDDDTVMLTVEDTIEGRRLLVNRQYISMEGGNPQLLSQLTEFGLDDMVDAKPATMNIEPLQPFSSRDSRSDGDDLSRFAMEESQGITPPPITVPR